MRKKHDLRMVPAATAAWIAAVLLVDSSSRMTITITVLAGVSAAVAARRWPAIALCLGGVTVIGASIAWNLALVESSPLSELAHARQTVEATVTLRDDPRPTPSGVERWSLTIREIDDRRNSWRLRVRATGFSRSDGPTLLPVAGATIRVRARLAPAASTNEAAVLRFTEWEEIESPAWWWTAAEGVRESIRAANSRYGDSAAALIPALVTGDEGGLDESIRDDFRRTGLTHLIAVSGSNLTIVLGAVLWLLHLTGGRRFAIPLGILVTIAFVLVARPEPSVQRAAVMGIVGLFALGRSTSPAGVRALAWAVIFLLFADPWLGSHAGFVLSVCATAGILLLGPPIADSFENWCPRPIALGLAVPLAAQLACLPTIAALTGEISLVSWVANLVATPAVAPATIAGLSAGLANLIASDLSVIAAEIAWFAASWIVITGEQAAIAPGAAVSWGFSSWWLVPIGLAAVPIMIRIGRSVRVTLFAVALLTLFIFRPWTPPWLPDGSVVVACDVGQGDAFVVPVAKKAGIVFDVGETPAAIDACLRSLGITKIPLVILTHDDADHVGGWAGLSRRREVGTVLVGPSGASGVSAKTKTVSSSDVYTIGDFQLEVLWPPAKDSRGTSNDQSLVTRLTTPSGERVLFTGDISAKAQRRLAHSDVRADIFKVPHHGSADSWLGLLDLVEPSIAVIGVGAENTYGHPAPDIVEGLEDRGIQILRTDKDGTFALTHKPTGWAVVRK